MKLAPIALLVPVGLTVGLVIGKIMSLMPTTILYLTAIGLVGFEIMRRRRSKRA